MSDLQSDEALVGKTAIWDHFKGVPSFDAGAAEGTV